MIGRRDRARARQATTNSRALTPLQTLFLTRLTRLVDLIDEGAACPPADTRRYALNRAVLSTIADCHAQGVGPEARIILARLRW